MVWSPEVSQIYNPRASLKKVDGENGPVSTCPQAPGQASILLRSQTEPLRSPLGRYLLQGSSILSHTQCSDSLYLFLLRIQAVYLNSCIINSPILRTDIFMCRDVWACPEVLAVTVLVCFRFLSSWHLSAWSFYPSSVFY